MVGFYIEVLFIDIEWVKLELVFICKEGNGYIKREKCSFFNYGLFYSLFFVVFSIERNIVKCCLFRKDWRGNRINNYEKVNRILFEKLYFRY